MLEPLVEVLLRKVHRFMIKQHGESKNRLILPKLPKEPKEPKPKREPREKPLVINDVAREQGRHLLSLEPGTLLEVRQSEEGWAGCTVGTTCPTESS